MMAQTQNDQSPTIGIDLGTTTSCVGVFDQGTVKILENGFGDRTTPSYVAFTDSERIVGKNAKRNMIKDPKNTVFDAKRLIGLKFNDEVVQRDIKYLPFDVINVKKKPKMQVQFQGQTKQYSPEEISSMVLTSMKETAEKQLNKKITKAVITVPAYFGESQRQSTKNAGKIAGLEVVQIINEPTAAAIAYGLQENLVVVTETSRNVLVYDFGGGTFDVTIMTIKDGNFTVKTVKGDSHLGGEDFTTRLVEYFKREFNSKYSSKLKSNLETNTRAMGRLREASEQAKCDLANTAKTTIEIDALHEGLDFDSAITRTEFEKLCKDLMDATMTHVENALTDAKMDKSEIHDVVMVGGSTRIVKIGSLLEDFFGKPPYKSINPDVAVAYGAAVQAAILSDVQSAHVPDIVINNITPLSLGIELADGTMSFLIKRNTPIPTRWEREYETSYDDQDEFLISVYEGEDSMVKNNYHLGEFCLREIPKGKQGEVKMTVTFDVNSDNLLTVTALNLHNNKMSRYEIRNTQRADEATIQKMIKNVGQKEYEENKKAKIIAAQKKLVSFHYKVNNGLITLSDTPRESPMGSQEQEDIKNCEKELARVFEWMDENDGGFAEPDEYEYRIQQLKDACAPVLGEEFKPDI